MSRIGKKAIDLPNGVKASVADGVVTVEGKSKLTLTLPPKVEVEVQEKQILVHRVDDSRTSSAMQGLARSLINNMVIGVVSGFKKELQIIGVGYRAQMSGNKLTLNVGFSQPREYVIPEGVKVTVTDNVKLTVEGADKQLVGETAATIRRFRKPEPYKGKGIRYVNEQVILKEGKSVG